MTGRKESRVTNFAVVSIGTVEIEFPEFVEGDQVGQKREPTADERAARYQTRLGKHTVRLDTLYPLLKAAADADTLATLLELAEECLRANAGVTASGKRTKVDADAFLKMRNVA